jgi:hypothetical protein
MHIMFPSTPRLPHLSDLVPSLIYYRPVCGCQPAIAAALHGPVASLSIHGCCAPLRFSSSRYILRVALIVYHGGIHANELGD